MAIWPVLSLWAAVADPPVPSPLDRRVRPFLGSRVTRWRGTALCNDSANCLSGEEEERTFRHPVCGICAIYFEHWHTLYFVALRRAVVLHSSGVSRGHRAPGLDCGSERGEFYGAAVAHISRNGDCPYICLRSPTVSEALLH